MSSFLKKMCRRFPAGALVLLTALFFFAGNTAHAQADGKALFMANCASCHHPLKDATGPALKGVDGRVPNKDWLYSWIKNSGAVLASGDPYATQLYAKWKANMTAFPNLKNEEIDAIITYVNSVEEVKPGGGGPGTPNTPTDSDDGSGWMYTLITVILALLVLVMWRVNSGLRRTAAEKVGEPVEKEIPVYRNKLFIAIGVILALAMGGYFMTRGAVNMGRQQNYMPEQPIFYSHAVHAGINQINCLYCHAGAEKSKHAMIPSTNVCMNCHKQIAEYTGAEEHPLKTWEGKEVNGTEEIKKLYSYAGYDPAAKDYIRNAAGQIQTKKLEWTKVHNLPDHVYFNHSQHVKVGGIACQQCHGDIQNMDEVYQFSSLSMGWCINCHRQTQVKFAENKYYSIYEKYAEELKAGHRTGVTVEDIGGIECQKCHY